MARKLLLAGVFLGWISLSFGQTIKITVDPEEVPLNQFMRITVTGENTPIQDYSGFPEIEGFVKRGSVSGISSMSVNGVTQNNHNITMRYAPRREGTFRIPDFTMTINGQDYEVKGRSIRVGPEVSSASRQKNDPFGSNFFDNFLYPDEREVIEYIEVADDAFLAVTVDKKEVYQGEGFNVTVGFYRGETSRAPFEFYNHNDQIAEIRRKVRPTNAWEEDFNINNHIPQRVQIGDKRYLQTKLYQATFYPLTLDTIRIPQVDLEMIKYKVARNPTFLGRNKQVDYKTFYSRPLTIVVKPLPPHPLRETVPVGDYRLQERIYEDELLTGKSTYYNLRITGTGNIATINPPELPRQDDFEIFDPIEQRDISRAGDRVSGQATFSYFITPRQPGNFNFGDFFEWIYFNPRMERYDTLRSNVEVRVTGDPVVEKGAQVTATGLFYDKINSADNTLHPRSGGMWWQIGGNVLLLLVLGATALLIFKK